MGLLSGLIVTGARNTASRALSQALGSGISSALTGGGGGGSGGSGGSTYQPGRYTPPQSNAVRNAQPGYVEEIVVPGATAPGAVAPPVGNAVAQAIAGGGTPGELAGVTVEGAAPQAQEQIAATASPAVQALLNTPANVAPIDVVAPTRAPLPSAEAAPLLAQGAQELLTLGSPDITQREELQPADDPSTIEQIAAVAPFAAMGLIPTMIGGPSASGGSFLDNLPIRDLIATGVLGAGLIAGQGGTGSAGDGLREIAENNKNLGNRLANIADAGMQGNIGGKGLSAIRRMVRKAQASIRQRYAGMGMSGTSAEQDDLNDAAEAGVEMQFKIGQQMAQTGLNAIAALTGQSAQAYLALMNAQTAKDTALGNALANFAGAIAR